MCLPNIIEATNVPIEGNEPRDIIYEIRKYASNENALSFVNVS